MSDKGLFVAKHAEILNTFTEWLLQVAAMTKSEIL